MIQMAGVSQSRTNKEASKTQVIRAFILLVRDTRGGALRGPPHLKTYILELNPLAHQLTGYFFLR